MRIFVIVLDSVGIGAAPDAADYGDSGSNTLANMSEAVGGMNLPSLQAMGLGNISSIVPDGKPIAGVPPSDTPTCAYGAMQESSQGKDTTTGHWEMMGIEMKRGFKLFPSQHPSFPPELIDPIVTNTGRQVLGNIAASGTAIIQELGEEHMRTGALIVYTSGDSVLQIAAHEEVVPLDELYPICAMVRELANPYRIGRVIARPFTGKEAGAFTRTENRRDFSYPLPEATVLNRLSDADIPVITVGKLDDIFAGSGVSEARHVENNPDAQTHMLNLALTAPDPSFTFANFIDFDMLYGHRRNAQGYADCLADTDRFLAEFLPQLREDDVLMITADHGNDPTFKGTDHTREHVPLLLRAPGVAGHSLGIRQGFYDIAQTIAAQFDLDPMPRGKSMI